eukprot:7381715-Prymnesium_polylepis.2
MGWFFFTAVPVGGTHTAYSKVTVRRFACLILLKYTSDYGGEGVNPGEQERRGDNFFITPTCNSLSPPHHIHKFQWCARVRLYNHVQYDMFSCIMYSRNLRSAPGHLVQKPSPVRGEHEQTIHQTSGAVAMAPVPPASPAQSAGGVWCRCAPLSSKSVTSAQGSHSATQACRLCRLRPSQLAPNLPRRRRSCPQAAHVSRRAPELAPTPSGRLRCCLHAPRGARAAARQASPTYRARAMLLPQCRSHARSCPSQGRCAPARARAPTKALCPRPLPAILSPQHCPRPRPS